MRNAAARFNQADFESAEARRDAARHMVAAARRLDVKLADEDAVVTASR